MLLVEGKVVRGVLGHNYATLSRRPNQNVGVVPMLQVQQVSRCYHIMSALFELFRNR